MADDEPRDWEALRSDAIRVVREAVKLSGPKAELAVDAVLSVVDEECVRALCAEHIKNTMIRSMDFRNGANLELQPARDMVAYWVAAARTLLGGAENYSETTVEWDFSIPEDPQRYSFVVQKVGKLTPHAARRIAEDERDELRAKAFTEADVKPCRHCGGPLIPCRRSDHDLPVCRGWLHAAWLSMPIGAHYCDGRSVNPSGEPGEVPGGC